nr:sperm-associated antigen 11B-like [Kogia breviceps]
MRQFLSPATLLLVVLFFPGLSRVTHADQQDTEGPKGPKQGSPGHGTKGSRLLRHQVEHRLLPRTPPLPDIEPDFKVVNCKRGDGRCQKYCNYMEVQLGYCSKKKDACCLPQY